MRCRIWRCCNIVRITWTYCMFEVNGINKNFRNKLLSKKSSCRWCNTSWHSCDVIVMILLFHDNVIKWKHSPSNWSFVRGIHRPPVNSSHKAQWRAALVFSLIWVWINDRVNNREAGDLRRYRAHYDVSVMLCLGIFHQANDDRCVRKLTKYEVIVSILEAQAM